MILPGLKWKTWSDVRRRSLEIHRQAIAWTNQNAVGMIDPQKEDAAFLDAEDAWLDDSARAIGIDRSMLERLAARGEIQWRENYGKGFEVRYGYGGKHLPMTIRPFKA